MQDYRHAINILIQNRPVFQKESFLFVLFWETLAVINFLKIIMLNKKFTIFAYLKN